MIVIQKATEKDIQSFLPLVKSYWEFEDIDGFQPEKISIQLRRLLADSNIGAGWIATSGDIAVGYLLAVYVFSLEHLGITAEIDEFFVLASYRGSGVGEKLLVAAETEFVRIGCTNVSLQLAQQNEAGRKFYLRHQYSKRSRYELLDKMLHC